MPSYSLELGLCDRDELRKSKIDRAAKVPVMTEKWSHFCRHRTSSRALNTSMELECDLREFMTRVECEGSRFGWLLLCLESEHSIQASRWMFSNGRKNGEINKNNWNMLYNMYVTQAHTHTNIIRTSKHHSRSECAALWMCEPYGCESIPKIAFINIANAKLFTFEWIKYVRCT